MHYKHDQIQNFTTTPVSSKRVKAMPKDIVLPTTSFSFALPQEYKHKKAVTTSTPLVMMFSDTPGLKSKKEKAYLRVGIEAINF